MYSFEGCVPNGCCWSDDETASRGVPSPSVLSEEFCVSRMLSDGAGRNAGVEARICVLIPRFLVRLKRHGTLRFLSVNNQHTVLHTSVNVGLTVQAVHDGALGLSVSPEKS
jgi:hypothetical protein